MQLFAGICGLCYYIGMALLIGFVILPFMGAIFLSPGWLPKWVALISGKVLWPSLIMIGIGYFGSKLFGRGVSLPIRRCASCGWIGTAIRWDASGGCPACGSDLYRI